jgi:hypothetical protein
MLEEILTLALLLSIGTHALLVKKCQVLEASIPDQTAGLHHGLTEVRELLDEALDMMGALGSSLPDLVPTQAASESLPNLILNTLLSRMGMAEDDGNKTQPQLWEIQEIDDPPTLQTEDQLG